MIRSRNLTIFLRSLKYLLLFSVVVLTALHASDISETIINSITHCFKTIIPALYPMLMISSLLSTMGFPTKAKRLIHKITVKIFGLSGNCSEAIFTGLLCGYNSAYISAADLYKNNKITLTEAQRIALFFTNPGISFCVIITGITYYNSSRLGTLFLCSNILSSAISAFVYNLFFKSTPNIREDSNNISLSDALINAVNSTTKALISISSWIILTSCLLSVFDKYMSDSKLHIILNIFAEVSSGIYYCKNNTDIFMTSVCLSFGGMSIFFQQLPLMKFLKINPLKALFYKIAATIVASGLFSILIIIFPINTDVFNIYNKKISLYNSPVGTLALILLVITYIYISLKDTNVFSPQKTKK